ncbi:TetR/AcrR family transcriptional regulator C-terminal domain-containing protein [Mycolicibacterium mucogenicum]|uniref:TetR/AcrR family transcriptional regulator C-terminal domain-containing protein n=1 Tax=Mycolicibacterium mucogenicum TaxID=56689 RepID=UPI001F370D75|nr:TetR/AcrR family transcriptional regulator C-terminal domain-containing protein [Mycolicibacterium mucogenicum]
MSIASTGRDHVALANLSVDRVVGEALALVNECGLESLTMRRLADRLRAHLPTIYRLVDGKDALIDEMAEAILAKALGDAPAGHQDWADHVKSLAAGLRSALLSQSDGARIVGGNYAAKRANLTFIDTLVGSVQAGGLAREHALWAASSLFCYVLGEVLEQQGAAGNETETLEGVLRSGDYPHLASGPVVQLLDFDARFDYGLNLLMAGIRSGADRSSPAPDADATTHCAECE